jgi:D-arginine dehydrogenase
VDRIVIVGAGFAGAATAYHLTRRGVRGVVVVEREAAPGRHASGRNAGLLRQSSEDPALAPLLRGGSRAARRILARVPGAVRLRGSLVLGAAAGRLHGGPRARLVDAAARLPGLEGRALFDPEDATCDPQALLGAFVGAARHRGAVFRCGEAVSRILTRNGRVAGVETDRGRRDATVVVVAAGAWAGEVARTAGATAVGLAPRRRHLFRARLPGADPDWPFVWHESLGVYFRPEGLELLASPCDAEPHAPVAPEVDEGQREILAARLDRAFGALGSWSVGAGWACLRTFTQDERFAIGFDPGVRGLFWVAGLGGHGMTAAWAVGRLAAAALLGRARPGPFDPARFA